MQIVLAVFAGIIVLSVFIDFKSIGNFFKKKDAVPVAPPVVVTPVDNTVVVVPTPAPVENLDRFADIVKSWEDFVTVLERNKMRECTEDMKTLLIKMAAEYRSDLNEDDNIEEEEASIDSIVVADEKTGV